MEKKLLLMKSLLQTCYFSLRFQQNIAILIATLMLYGVNNFLFYSDHFVLLEFGLNVFIMTVISLITVIVIHQPALNNRNFWWASFGIFISSLNLFYHDDLWAFIMFFISYFLFVGHLHGKKFQNLIMGFFQWFVINICSPISLIIYLSTLDYWDKKKWNSLNKKLNLIVIPIILFILFIGIYSLANDSFRALFEPIVRYISSIHLSMNLENFVFFVISSFMILPFMIPIHKKITISSTPFQKNVHRKRKKIIAKTYKTMGLTNELKIATLSFIGLNVLVFLFNILDLINVWISQSEKTAVELSKYVHDGTNLIIVSIVIGTALILIFFRQNLNFHPKNVNLKRLAFLWLAQNAFLAFSVIRRNIHYIDAYGLTQKRLGVMIFIILVLVGLFICYEKVSSKRSFMWFFNKLCLSLFLIALNYSVINHDRLIIYHAIYLQKEHIDLNYLNTLSSHNVDLLLKHKHILESKSIYSMEVAEYRYRNTRSQNWREWNIIDFNNKEKKNRYLNIKLK